MYYSENYNCDELLEDFLMHYGVGHDKGGHSGRYPWGSGDDPYQHNAGDFLNRVKEMRQQNISFTDNRKFLVDDKGNEYPNKDYGKTFTGDTAIAKSMGLSTKQFRAFYAIAYNEDKTKLYNRVQSLANSGKTPTEIGKEVGINESSVRSLLKSGFKLRQEKSLATADFIKNRVDSKGMTMVGSGVEKELNISRNMFDTALAMLENEGYPVYSVRVPQPTDTTGSKQSIVKVICPPGTQHKDVYDYGKINSLVDYISKDGGESFEKKVFHYPASMDSSRLKIRYAEEGGIDKDGIIEIRRGVEDLSLGNDNYAQVRILVDGDNYLKGMAMYSDDLPDGVDVLFNTNKKVGTPIDKVLKPIKRDIDGNPSENPFGSAVKETGGQYYFIDSKGKEKLGLINKTRGEGDWNEWSNKVPSQFLSKQTVKLAKNQLKLTTDLKKDEFNDILMLDNPTVKKQLLNSFAEDCDSVAVHLKAASLPRQSYQVILPISEMKDNEVFAPNYKNGETVALIRYPHGGIFEIPKLTVNNKQKDARRILGNDVKDCVGINSNVASILSGADFDGDTVMVIPISDKVNIKSSDQLEGLKGFEPKLQYGAAREEVDSEGKTHYFNAAGYEYPIMKDTQMEMGEISNLITDMTIKGANTEELARAVKHSMVVIDAAKHNLDYKSSERENGIAALKRSYQKKVNPETGKVRYGGASTIVSKAKSPQVVDKRQGSPKVNIKGTEQYDPSKPEGSLIYKTADDLTYLAIKNPETKKDVTVIEVNGKYYYNKSADKKVKEYVEVEDLSKIKVKNRTVKSTKMAETDDAYTLVSEVRSPMEIVYADFANSMKDLANKARIESYNTKEIAYSPSAASAYSKEVKELDDELFKAEKNAPREKQALLIANSKIKAILDSNPDLDKDEEKKIRQRELTNARALVGANRYNIEITDDQYEAIQAGAVSPTKLKRILDHSDMEVVKERATPRGKDTVSQSKINIMKDMLNNGYTYSQIAERLDVSVSTIEKYLGKK